MISETSKTSDDIKTPKRIAVFIPAYFAEYTLQSVVQRIPEKVFNEIFIVLIQDDASTDNTARIAQHLSLQYEKITATSNEINLGYGGTQKKAYKYLLSCDVDIVVMLHGDGQYSPEEISQLYDPLLTDLADVTMGSRMLGDPRGGGMPIHRRIANRVLTALLSIATNWHMTDPHSGFFAITRDALQAIDYESMSSGHESSADLFIRSWQAGLRLIEIPVTTHYGQESRSMSLPRGVRYSFYCIKLFFITLVYRIKMMPRKPFSDDKITAKDNDNSRNSRTTSKS